MAEITEADLDDANHWRVDLRGTIEGVEITHSYHLAAESKNEARRQALLRFSGPWDEIPHVQHVERYRNWRTWESRAEGRCGM